MITITGGQVAGMEQAVSVNAPSHIAVTADLSSATWNTAETHEVFTVTGAVRIRVWGVCTESLVGNGMVGIVTELLVPFFATISMDAIDGGHIMSVNGDYAPANFVSDAVADWVVFDHDIGLEIVNEPATAGTLVLHCVWEPLSAGATVVAGAGGQL